MIEGLSDLREILSISSMRRCPAAPFRCRNRTLQELLDDVLDVLADVAGFGEGGGVGHHEGDVQAAAPGSGRAGLAGTGGADQQDVALASLDVVGGLGADGAGACSGLDGHREDASLAISWPITYWSEDGADFRGSAGRSRRPCWICREVRRG